MTDETGKAEQKFRENVRKILRDEFIKHGKKVWETEYGHGIVCPNCFNPLINFGRTKVQWAGRVVCFDCGKSWEIKQNFLTEKRSFLEVVEGEPHG